MLDKIIDRIAAVIVIAGTILALGYCLYGSWQITCIVLGLIAFSLSAVRLMDRAIDKDLERLRRKHQKLTHYIDSLDHGRDHDSN